MRALITGSGMLATALANSCSIKGIEAQIAAHNQLDITDARAVGELVERLQPEIVFHTAALTRVNHCEEHPDEALRVNRDGTANVVAAVQTFECALIYFSTDYVFTGTKETPYLEEDPPGPLNVYGASKLAGEEHVLAYGRGHVVRTSGVFGPRAGGGERNFVRAILEQLRGGTGSIPVVSDQLTAITFAPQLAAMLLELLPAGLPRVLHLTSSGADSWYGWAQQVALAAGADPRRIVPSHTPADAPVRRPVSSVLGTLNPKAADLIARNLAVAGIVEYVAGIAQTA